jgi:N-acetyl-anhydromuramyl-L-alanine amidase AmpD
VQEGWYVPYPEKQLKKLVALCKALVKKYPAITRDNVLTHYGIATPEGRKVDPFGLDVEAVKDQIFDAEE